MSTPSAHETWRVIQTALQDPNPTLFVGLPPGVEAPLADLACVTTIEFAPEDCHSEVSEKLQTGPQNLVLLWDLARARRAEKHSFLQIALMSIVQKMARGSKILTFMPADDLSSGRTQDFREFICEFGWPRMVIYPCNSRNVSFEGSIIDSIHPTFRLYIIIIDLTEPSKNSATQFFQWSTDEPFTQVIDQLEVLVKSPRGKCKFGFSKHPPLGSDVTWLPDFHSPAIRKKEVFIQQLGRLEALGRLARIFVGRQVKVNKKSAGYQKGVRALHGREILPDGSLDLSQGDIPREEFDEHLALQVGDLVIRWLVSPTQKTLAIHEVDATNLPLLPGRTVIVIRPNQNFGPEGRQLLRNFLKSEIAMDLLRSRGLVWQVTVSLLSELPIPVPSEQVGTSLECIEEARKLFACWAHQAVKAQNEVFRDALLDPVRPLLATGRRLRQIAEAGRMVDAPGHRIRTLFPFPIAFRWRQVEGAKPDLEGYVHVLEAAEVAWCYLAAVSLSVAWATERYLPNKCAQIAKNLAAKRGLNLGDWTALLDELAARITSFKRSSALQEIWGAWTEDETRTLVSRLSRRRNDQSHGRGPKSSRIKPEFEGARDELLQFLQKFECLTDYPLRYIETTKRNSILKCTSYDYRDLVGDHDVVPVRSATTEDPDLEAESLYLVDGDGRLRLLRPMLSRLCCEHCGHWSTFHLDGAGPKVKSLEHGHSMVLLSEAEAFTELGLLLPKPRKEEGS